MFYLKGRNTQLFLKKALFFGLGIVSYLLAVGSKQNAITLPLAWLLVEIVFYDRRDFGSKAVLDGLGIGIVAGLAAFFVLVLFYWQADPISAIMDGYQRRPFTMSQRLLTELRVLIFHLGQLFYPVPQQFSIMHDFTHTTSLFTPLTTLGALLLSGHGGRGAVLSAQMAAVVICHFVFFPRALCGVDSFSAGVGL